MTTAGFITALILISVIAGYSYFDYKREQRKNKE